MVCAQSTPAGSFVEERERLAQGRLELVRRICSRLLAAAGAGSYSGCLVSAVLSGLFNALGADPMHGGGAAYRPGNADPGEEGDPRLTMRKSNFEGRRCR